MKKKSNQHGKYKLSVILPAYSEPFLNSTINSILENTSSATEIVPVLDGYVPKQPVIEDPRVNPVHLKRNVGMRGAINKGIENAKGDYVMKMDAHCAVAEGFDEILLSDAEENWLVVPRRLSLREDIWGPDRSRLIRDYHYFNFPAKVYYGYYMGPTSYRGPAGRGKIPLDETMTFQGSCWMANRDYLMKEIYPLDDRKETYGSFYHEHGEIGLKYWLKGGKIMANKKTWYAHLSKRRHHYKAGLFARRYKKNRESPYHHAYLIKHWLNDEEPGIKHPFSWLVEKFWPLPGWKDDWQEQWKKIKPEVEKLCLS